MTVGQSDVRCCGEILRIRTRKHKKTCACIVGMEETFKLSVNRSESKMVDIFPPLHEVVNHVHINICFQLYINSFFHEHPPSRFFFSQKILRDSTHIYKVLKAFVTALRLCFSKCNQTCLQCS